MAADDEEVAADEQQDEFASYFEHGLAAKIIVTTSRRASANAQAFATELADIFPGAEYIRRQPNYDIQHIQKFAAERGYTDLLIVNNDTKTINALTVVHLPEGPTMHFRLTSVKMAKRIRGHGKAQEEYEPELILNGFGTRLGHTVGRQLAALFPHVPKFHGRQVCTVGQANERR